MKINELMIGDWVFYPSLSIYIKIAQIKGNTIISELAECSPGMMYDVTPHVSDIEPIPLTVEILTLNGFEVQEQGGGRQDVWNGFGKDNENDIDIIFMDGKVVHTQIDGIGCYFKSCKIRYVHEFQHVLRLCGIDKNIEL